MSDLPAAFSDLRGLKLDAERVKVLAHPLRSRLVSALRRGGPATATELARELGTNTGATSYHLRRLADVGLVEDTGEGTGRRRLWQAASDYHAYSPTDFDGDEDAETAMNWLRRDYLRHLTERTERWFDVESTWPGAWRDRMGVNDAAVVVTPDQVQAMRDEIDAVVQKYRRVGQGNPAARRVTIWTVYAPIDLDRPPRGGRR